MEQFYLQDDVSLVIDMEGLRLDTHRRFQCRELGYCSWQDDVGRFAFRPIKPFNKLTRKERRQWNFVHDNIHGLPYYPDRDKEEIKHNPRAVVKQLYDEFRTEHRSRVAFKGGDIERSLLIDAKTPYLDLETLGCPKFNNMIMPRGWDHGPGCGMHKHYGDHCAMIECKAFMHWYKSYMTHF